MAGLVPAIPLRISLCPPDRDARDRRGHDGRDLSCLALYPADLAHGGFDTGGVGIPELRKLGLVLIPELLPEIRDRRLKQIAVRRLVQHLTELGHDRLRRALRC